MNNEDTAIVVERDAIQSGVVSILKDMTSEWESVFEPVEIGPETHLGADLDLDSMRLVQLVTNVEEFFKVKGLPFHKLLLSEERRDHDLSVGDIVAFLYDVLNDR